MMDGGLPPAAGGRHALRQPVKLLMSDHTWRPGVIVGRSKPVGQPFRYDVNIADGERAPEILQNIPADHVFPADVGPRA